jgi:CheY-like chemotaxis protein/predicted transcriptional regulator
MNHRPSPPTLLAKDLMNPEAVPLRPGTFEKDLALQFLSRQDSGWPVVDPTRKILGVVTEVHLLQACTRLNSLDDLRVEDTMTTPVYVFENDSLDKVLNMMVQRQVLRMPVVGDGNLVGVISWEHALRHCLPLSSSSSRFVSLCAWCERVHDTSEGSARTKVGRDLASSLSIHHLKFSDIDLAHTHGPLSLQTLQTLSTTSRSLSPKKSEGKGVHPCLLVVDDDPSVVGVLSQALQEWGYDVCVASNGWEGLAVASRRSVDGILLDMHMPIMDGRTMLDELRWLGHQMPVVMMSGGSDERVLRPLLKEGAQGFFLKSFHLTSLKQVCRQVFPKKEVKEQASSHFHVA